MRIHFVTTKLGDGSGGAIYDRNFYKILLEIYPGVKLFDDEFFLSRDKKIGQHINFWKFNDIYKQHLKELMNCDYLVINSRLYTRFIKLDFADSMRRYSDVKLIVIHHHNNYMTHAGVMRIIHKYFEMRILKCAEWLVIPNQYVIDELQDHYHFNNFCFLPSSFEKKKYNASSLDHGRILFVGNVEKRKGLIYGLKAFHFFYLKNKNYQFVIAGRYDKDSLYFKRLNRYIKKNHLEHAVLFEGRVTNARLDWLYSNSDLFLFPSLLEGYGWVMMEAMARGVPVIAFRNSSMPYTVKSNYNGMLVDNRCWKKMGRALNLIEDKKWLRKMQQGALATYHKAPSQKELNKKTKLFIQSWK